MGRLAGLYFGKRVLKDYKHTYGIVVAIFFYALLGPFPVAVLLIFNSRVYRHQNSSFCLPVGDFTLQRIDLAPNP
jgi:hypothetical protein